MSGRDFLSLALLGGVGYVAYKMLNGTDISEVIELPTTVGKPNAFEDVLAQVESGGRAWVKAATSSASGLFQFTKGTWTGLGFKWGNDPTKAFGGLTPTIAEQKQAIGILIGQNAAALARAGIAASNPSLYAAHFLGPSAAISVLRAAGSTPIENVVSPATVKANAFLKGMTVADFKRWLVKKVGA